MGQDNQPKARQAAQLARKKAQRAGHDRILIVSEGSKTEPHYFGEIRNFHRLHTANVQLHPSALGTQPLQVVEFAERLFLHGDHAKGVQARAFEQVYALFDRDEHPTYHAALEKAQALQGRLRSDLGVPVRFKAVATVPSFELWLLLHFEDVLAPMHRTEVHSRLRLHLPDYAKGELGQFAATRANLGDAMQRAKRLAAMNSAHDGKQPYTDIHLLVGLLTALKLA